MCDTILLNVVSTVYKPPMTILRYYVKNNVFASMTEQILMMIIMVILMIMMTKMTEKHTIIVNF